jgi:lipopolysaccharide biosynthesis glycosyltransferase
LKLFLTTNSDTLKTDNIKLLEVSVMSALKNTNFDIFVIFDGKKEELESKLPKDINIIEHRHRCYDTFKNSGRDLKTASSTFLRTEIPFLMKKLGLDDEYCLYTDYDVIFMEGDYSKLEKIKPKYFSACPENNQNNWSYINAGVMLMNIKQFSEDDENNINFIKNNFNKDIFKDRGYDQPILNHIYKNKWDKLSLDFNWKPYWGINNEAKIIHSHGPKPRLIEPKWRYDLPQIKSIRERNLEGYDYYSNIFEQYLK